MVERTTNQFLLRLQKAITNYEKTDLPAANTGLAKVAVQCSADTFVVKIATFAKPENVIGHLATNNRYNRKKRGS